MGDGLGCMLSCQAQSWNGLVIIVLLMSTQASDRTAVLYEDAASLGWGVERESSEVVGQMKGRVTRTDGRNYLRGRAG